MYGYRTGRAAIFSANSLAARWRLRVMAWFPLSRPASGSWRSLGGASTPTSSAKAARRPRQGGGRGGVQFCTDGVDDDTYENCHVRLPVDVSLTWPGSNRPRTFSFSLLGFSSPPSEPFWRPRRQRSSWYLSLKVMTPQFWSRSDRRRRRRGLRTRHVCARPVVRRGPLPFRPALCGGDAGDRADRPLPAADQCDLADDHR
jgi:hypothetical protein